MRFPDHLCVLSVVLWKKAHYGQVYDFCLSALCTIASRRQHTRIMSMLAAWMQSIAVSAARVNTAGGFCSCREWTSRLAFIRYPTAGRAVLEVEIADDVSRFKYVICRATARAHHHDYREHRCHSLALLEPNGAAGGRQRKAMWMWDPKEKGNLTWATEWAQCCWFKIETPILYRCTAYFYV